jgi:hypothetical protein
MSSELLILLIWYLIIPSSILGYGAFFQKIIFKNKFNFNIGYLGIIGIFFLIIYSYLSNFFIPHSKIHNLILLTIGFIFFLYFFFIKKREKKIINVFYLNLLIVFIAVFIFKNHDDFEYYHFPYTYLLTQHDLIIGIGNFGHGFRTQSSLFYLNSLFYLPLANYYLFNLGAVLILFFTNLVLINNIFENYTLNNFKFNDKFFKYLSLLTLIFINIFFYRISEHGTDRSSQILVLLLFIEIIYFFNIKKLSDFKLFKIYLLLGLIISFKAFYILYLIVFSLLFIHAFRVKKKIFDTINFFILNKFFIFFVTLVFLILITNILNTGCFIYPVYFTCLENYTWSIPIDQVKQMNNWYELWSKAGAGPEFRILNPDEHIINFNWVDNWFSIYFFNKVTDLLFGLFILSSSVLIIFYRQKKKLNSEINHIKALYVLIFILFIEWFFNHPALRYGGYVLIASFFFLPLSYQLSASSIKSKDFIRKAIVVILITFLIFFLRNISRINKEYKKYEYNLFQSSFYNISEKHFRIEKKLETILEKNNFCKSHEIINECLGGMNKTSKKFGKIIIEHK